MNIDLTSPPLPRSLTLSAGIDWVSECVDEVRAKAEVDFALVSALIERMEDRSTITLMSDGLAQLRGRARQAAAAETA